MIEPVNKPLLMLISKDGCQPLRDGEQYVGRSSECALILRDTTVSRKHARVLVENGAVHVEDLGSANGTFIDGVAVSSSKLPLLSQVQFGGVTFQLISQDIPAPGTMDDESTERLKRPEAPIEGISNAQHRVLTKMLSGMTEKEIAGNLRRSQHTIHNHIRNIYRILGIKSRAALVRLFLPGGGKNGKPKSDS